MKKSMRNDVHVDDSTNATPLSDFEKTNDAVSITSHQEDGASSDYGKRPACFRNTAQEVLFVLTTTVAVGMNSIFGGSILCMTNAIGEDLSMNAAEVTWLWAGQNLAAGALLLFFGRLADLFGRRLQLILSMVFFTIFMVVAGFATNAIYIDVFSGLIGIACAASVPPAIGKLGAVYEKPSWRKNRAFSCFSAGYPVGFVIGAFISGVATEIASWRATFWVMAVIYFFFTIAAWWTVPPDTEQRLGGFNRATLAQFDFLGAFLAVAGLATFTASLTLAGDARDGWSTPYVPALLVIGVIFIAGCIYWQSIFKHPLMPLGIWKDKNFTLLVLALCMGFYGFTGNLFWITLVWQRIDRNSPLMVAVKLLPAAIGGICVNIMAAFIMHRVSNKLLMLIAATGMVIASALWSAISDSLPYWALSFPALLFSVLGADLQFNVVKSVLTSYTDDHILVCSKSPNTDMAQYVRYVESAFRTAVNRRRLVQHSIKTDRNCGTSSTDLRIQRSGRVCGRCRFIALPPVSGNVLGQSGWGGNWPSLSPFHNDRKAGRAQEVQMTARTKWLDLN